MIKTIKPSIKKEILSHLKPIVEILAQIDNEDFPLRDCYRASICSYIETDGIVEDPDDSFLFEDEASSEATPNTQVSKKSSAGSGSLTHYPSASYYCENCLFWSEFYRDQSDLALGHCRRYAPRPMQSLNVETDSENVAWPVTRMNESCGDFKVS